MSVWKGKKNPIWQEFEKADECYPVSSYVKVKCRKCAIVVPGTTDRMKKHLEFCVKKIDVTNVGNSLPKEPNGSAKNGAPFVKLEDIKEKSNKMGNSLTNQNKPAKNDPSSAKSENLKEKLTKMTKEELEELLLKEMNKKSRSKTGNELQQRADALEKEQEKSVNKIESLTEQIKEMEQVMRLWICEQKAENERIVKQMQLQLQNVNSSNEAPVDNGEIVHSNCIPSENQNSSAKQTEQSESDERNNSFIQPSNDADNGLMDRPVTPTAPQLGNGHFDPTPAVFESAFSVIDQNHQIQDAQALLLYRRQQSYSFMRNRYEWERFPNYDNRYRYAPRSYKCVGFAKRSYQPYQPYRPDSRDGGRCRVFRDSVPNPSDGRGNPRNYVFDVPPQLSDTDETGELDDYDESPQYKMFQRRGSVPKPQPVMKYQPASLFEERHQIPITTASTSRSADDFTETGRRTLPQTPNGHSGSGLLTIFKSPITVLQEHCIEMGYELPQYELCFESGVPPMKHFIYMVAVNDQMYMPAAPSSNKKDAKTAAAIKALRELGVRPYC